MRSKIHSYLGFSKRSRTLLSGYNACLYGMERGRIQLLILATDLADNTKEKCIKTAQANGVLVCIYQTVDWLSSIAGEVNRGIYGIGDRELARVILKEIDLEEAEIERQRQKQEVR